MMEFIIFILLIIGIINIYFLYIIYKDFNKIKSEIDIRQEYIDQTSMKVEQIMFYTRDLVTETINVLKKITTKKRT